MSGRGFRVELSKDDASAVHAVLRDRPELPWTDRLWDRVPLLLLVSLFVQLLILAGIALLLIPQFSAPPALITSSKSNLEGTPKSDPSARSSDPSAAKLGLPNHKTPTPEFAPNPKPERIASRDDASAKTPPREPESTQNPVLGIDVSHFQGDINWNEVATDGVRFAFIKATQGREEIDPCYVKNWTEAKAAGVRRGAYHFFDPLADADEQAEHFLKTVKVEAGDLPPALDLEGEPSVPTSDLTAKVKRWLTLVENQLSCKPLVYTDRPFAAAHLDVSQLSDYPLWVADYGKALALPTGWTNWIFWQYSEEGKRIGIAGAVDLNRFNGDQTALNQLSCQGGRGGPHPLDRDRDFLSVFCR